MSSVKTGNIEVYPEHVCEVRWWVYPARSLSLTLSLPFISVLFPKTKDRRQFKGETVAGLYHGGAGYPQGLSRTFYLAE